MRNRFAALCAASIAVAVVTATIIGPAAPIRGVEVERAIGGGDLGPDGVAHQAAQRKVHRQERPKKHAAPAAPTIAGAASNYPTTAGWDGQAVVALPGVMGGRYTGDIQGYATICADRCARVAVVDWCQCYWGTADERVVDLSYAAWPLVTDRPLSAGLVQVRVILDDPRLAAAWRAST